MLNAYKYLKDPNQGGMNSGSNDLLHKQILHDLTCGRRVHIESCVSKGEENKARSIRLRP